jgi:hypothetical protein
MRTTFMEHFRTIVWGYVLGPFLAFLPSRWRAKWFANRHFPWRGATIVSGMLQFLTVPILLIIWGKYQYLFLVANALHPTTWLVYYILIEGAGRSIVAVSTGETPGTLLFVLPDLLYCHFKKRKARGEPQLSDLVTQDDLRADWQLKIESARPKRDWQAGRLLRYADHYYRIEACCDSGGPRAVVYLLRRLPMGVPSRSVIIYPQFEAAGQSR